MSDVFEQAFADAERSAVTAGKAGALIVSAARQMQKAAQQGDIGKLRRAAERLGLVSDAARQDVANARNAWPFTEGEERDYLANDYVKELQDEASRAGLKIYERDSNLLAFPSVVKLMPSELAVRIDKKRIPTIRPGYLVRLLLANQKKKPRQSADKFIECLYETYKIITAGDRAFPVVKLSQVYRMLTLLPGSKNDYTKSDFALDLFTLDRSGLGSTSSGAMISLPASTGTRGGGGDLFTFVAPDGEVKTYFGLRFTEA